MLGEAGLAVAIADGVDWIAARPCVQLVADRTLSEWVSDHHAVTATLTFGCDQAQASGAH